MSFFDDDFLESLNSDPKFGLYELCAQFISYRQQKNQINSLSYHLEFYAFTELYIECHDLQYQLPDVSSGSTGDKITQINNFASSTLVALSEYVRENKENEQLEKFRKNFLHNFSKNVFHYEFTDGDISRIQLLINELREEIKISPLFEEKHKRRLMKRLEKLQGELHKKVSDIDHFWGLVGDAGVVIGKFGKDAKPFVDRIKEITNIIWKVQSRAEELPSNIENPNMLDFDE